MERDLSAAPLRNAWYYAAPSATLRAGAAGPKTMLDEPILLGRTRDGVAFALRDICPHRGIPLHFGRFDGVQVTCAYHGWQFDRTGACTAIPPLAADRPEAVSRVRVKAYPVAERHGGIWVCLGEAPETAPPLPELPAITQRAPQLVERMRFPGGIDHTAIGLMDPGHGPYVHGSWFWRRSAHEKSKAFEPVPWGFRMVRHVPSANSRAYRLLRGDLSTEITFQLPSYRWEHIIAGRHSMVHLTTLTPITAAETEVHHSIFWSMRWLDPLRPLLRPFARKFLDQDRRLIAQQGEGLVHDPPLLLLGDPDAQARWYYRLKAEFIRSTAENRPFVNPVRPRTLHWRS